jgi:hypothetical protein
MNIFAIDRNPSIAAKHLVDAHCVKMVLESAQMLANCFSLNMLASPDCPRTLNGKIRKYSYVNHPCSKWVRLSKSNMLWLIEHAIELDNERVARFRSKPHFSLKFIIWCRDNINLSIVPDGVLTEFAQAIPVEYKHNDSVVAYRNFYRHGKKHLHNWKRNKPEWI